MSTTTKINLEEVRSLALALLRAWPDHPERHTEILEGLAMMLVDARSQFTTDDGVDWGGRSWDYRQWVSKLYDDAGLDDVYRRKIQASVRYHVGNLLREKVDPSELERVGLLASSPKDRLNRQRTMGSMLVEQPWRIPRDSGRAWFLVIKSLAAAVEHLDSLELPRKLEDGERLEFVRALQEYNSRIRRKEISLIEGREVEIIGKPTTTDWMEALERASQRRSSLEHERERAISAEQHPSAVR
jgi:hypothetical protein